MWILPKQLHTLACALDMEALSLDLSESSQICAQSLFVRSKPLPARTWFQKWKRDSWTQHLFGRILKPSLGEHFVTAWTSSLEVIRASHSAQLDSDEERTTRGTCGRGLQMEFDLCAQDSASLKTSKDISAWGCPTSSKTWSEWVTELRGEYSARLKSARLTSASVCSSWPTPNCPSPHDSDNTAGSLHCFKKQYDLIAAVRDNNGQQDRKSRNTNGNLLESSSHQRNQQAGKLNPRWVETLMGLPVGFTMPSCASPVTIVPMNCGYSETA